MSFFFLCGFVGGASSSGLEVVFAVARFVCACLCGNSKLTMLCVANRGSKFPESKIKATTDKSLLKSLATPEDVADQIKTLVLSKSMTGQNVVMDCGIIV